MSLKQSRDEVHEFAQRQAAVLSARGASAGDVEQRLGEVLGPTAASRVAATPYPLIDSLIEVADPATARVDMRHRILARVLAHSEVFGQVVRAAASVQIYAIGVGIVASIVWLIWLIRVAPEITRLYAQTGTELPQLTQLFANPVAGGLVLTVIWLVILTLAWATHALRRVFRSLQAPSALLRGLPGIGPLVVLFEDWLTAVSAQELLGEAEPQRVVEALRQWRKRSGLRSLNPDKGGFALGHALTAAARLETLDAESAWQAQRLGLEFPIQAAKSREWVMMALLLVFGVGIGAMVISMYLPIFKLATVL